jgi:Flp pilus assembly protein TadD
MRTTTGAAMIVLVAGAGAFFWATSHMRKPRATTVSSSASPDSWSLPSNPTAGPDWDSAVAASKSGDHRKAALAFLAGEHLHPTDAAWPQAEAVCWARAGSDDSALAALDRCLAIAPLSQEARSLRRASRLQLGFVLAGGGQSWRGRQLGEAVLQDFPDDTDARLLVGYSHAMDGSAPVAESILTKLVQEHPGQVQAWEVLVQCALRRGDAQVAEARLAELSNRDPGSLEVQALRLQVAALRDRKSGTSNGHLRVVCAESCPQGLESEVLSTSEDAWNFLRPSLGYEPTDPVVVLVGGGTRAPHWAAASFDGQVHIPLDAAQDPAQRTPILRHELTHAFLAQAAIGRVPLWLNEGLAQYFQGERIHSLPGSSTAGWLDSLPSRRTFMDLDEDQAELAYHYSLAVAQELMELHNTTALEAYLGHLREGLDESDAFRKSFGDDYAHLSSRIRARL